MSNWNTLGSVFNEKKPLEGATIDQKAVLDSNVSHDSRKSNPMAKSIEDIELDQEDDYILNFQIELDDGDQQGSEFNQ